MLTPKQQSLLQFLEAHLLASGTAPSFEQMRIALNLKSKSGIHRLVTALEERGFIRRLPNRARALEVIRNSQSNRIQTVYPVAIFPMRSPAFTPIRPSTYTPVVTIAEPEAKPWDGTPDNTTYTPEVGLKPFPPSIKPMYLSKKAIQGITDIPFYGKIAAGTPVEALQGHTETIPIPSLMLGSGSYYALRVDGDSMIEDGILPDDIVIIKRAEEASSGQTVVALIDGCEVTLKRLRLRGQIIALEPANGAYETRLFDASRVQVQGILHMLVRSY